MAGGQRRLGALTGRRAVWLAAGLMLAALLALLTGFGPSVPGVAPREWLGLIDKPPDYPACTPNRRHVFNPRSPTPPPGSWKPEGPSPMARIEVRALSLDGRIYLAGGQGRGGVPQRRMVTYDPRRNRYGRIPDSPTRLDHTLLAARRDELYLVGGYMAGGHPTARVWRYSLASRRWTERQPLRLPRGGHDGAVIGDRLYAVGGAPRTFPEVYAKPYASLEVYDFRRDRWTPGPDMPTARHHTSATALGGKLYVVGGRVPTDFSVATFERFDPKRNAWERLPPLPLGVSDVAVVAANGEVIAIGGDEEEHWERLRGWSTPAVWAFSPRTERWRRLPDLGIARHGHAAAVTGGRIWAFEGSPCPGSGRMRSVESLSLRHLQASAR